MVAMNAHASLVLLEMAWNVKVMLQNMHVLISHLLPCITCIDVDECEFEELNECHEKAFCNNTFGSYHCVCNTGYTGNGTNCTGIYTFMHMI